MKTKQKNIKIIITVSAIIIFSFFLPSIVSSYKDKLIVGKSKIIKREQKIEGFKYQLSNEEKLYIVSNALNSRVQSQSDFYALSRPKEKLTKAHETFALLPNNKDLSKSKIFVGLEKELKELYSLKIIPEIDFTVNENIYSIASYTATDVLEPSNNVDILHIVYNPDINIMDLKNNLIECYLDYESGKILDFSIRSSEEWDYYEIDNLVDRWSDYLEIKFLRKLYDTDDFYMKAKHMEKYEYIDEKKLKTVVSFGFYEGINEFFIKISI